MKIYFVDQYAFSIMHAFPSLLSLQKFDSFWKSPPITGSSGWFWGEMKRWVAKAKVILWFWRKTKGIKEPLAFVERIADIYRNVKFDRVVLTFVSKILGRFSSAPKLYCSWKLWAKVNYKQLHLATKSIWGFNPILEQIAWKCKIDCLLELEGEEGEGRDIKISKFGWCTIPQWSRLQPQNQCNLFVILSGFSLKFHL